MKKGKTKIKAGIFPQLVISYILFAILIVVTFTILMGISVMGIAGGASKMAGPFDRLDEKGNVRHLSLVRALNGWVEVLDEDYHILKVYGEKQTEKQQYSDADIFKLLNVDAKSDQKYSGGIEIGELDGKKVFYLTIYNRDVVSLGSTIMLGSDNALSGWSQIFIIGFVAIFGLECIGFGYYLSRKIRRPLKKMVEGMEKIKGGNRSVRLCFKTEAEFEKIKNTFNDMMETIEKQEIEKAEVEAKKSKMMLELSHDIKTPLATIKSYAAALEAGIVKEDKKEEFYHRIDEKANRVCQLAEDMFIMLKMDDLDYRPDKKKENICELIRQICADFYDELESSGLQFLADIPEHEIPVKMDANLLSRAVGELIINAVKYNKTGSMVSVRVGYRRDVSQTPQVYIKVEDDGEAIKEDLKATLFDAFSRGDVARKTDGGTGLGLSIVKAIIERHNGKILYKRIGIRNSFQIYLQVLPE